MLTKEEKIKQINELSDQFKESQASFIVEFNHMNAGKMTDFRTQLRAQKAQVKVIRNTLAMRALESHTKIKEAYKDSLKGVNVFVFTSGDISKTAKILSNFKKEVETLKLKKAMIGEEVLGAAEIEQLAKLPPLEVLKAQFLSVLMAPATQLVRTLNEVPSSFVRLIQARSKSEKDKEDIQK